MMQRCYFFTGVVVCFLFLGEGWTQPRPCGMLVDSGRYAELPVLPTYSGVKYNEIPLHSSLKPYCPVPGDQGDMGACVGWAVGYGALTISQAVRADLKDKAALTELAHSAAFVYNQIKTLDSDCTAGAFVEDALELLLQQGDCLQQTFNFEAGHCNQQPDRRSKEEALQYRILDYAAVFQPTDPPKVKVAKVCKVLAAKKPIIAGLQITDSFWRIRPGQAYWHPTEEETPQGYHSMVITGYDNIEKQFELLNSFGPAWGDNGFIKISYENFSRLCRYGYILLLDATEVGSPMLNQIGQRPLRSQPKSLSGAFVFRRPAGYLTRTDGQKVPFFEEVPARYDNEEELYTARQPFFEVGDAFQLVARAIPEGRYVYVFSKQQAAPANLHFPKREGGQATAGFVLTTGAEIVIPSEEAVLQLAVPGVDYLCILYSATKINDISARLQQLDETEDFRTALRTAFGDLLIPEAEVQRDPYQMAFQVNRGELAGPGVAVLIILKVMAK